MSGTIKLILILLIITGPITSAEASWGSAIYHGMKVVSSKTSHLFGKASSSVGHTAGKTAQKASGKLAAGVAAGLGSKAGAAAVKTAASTSQLVLDSLGIKGMTALAKLPASQATRLADLSGVLARSPHKAEWLSLISKHGSTCLNWLHANKGGIAVAAGSGAILLAPDAFLSTVREVTVAGVDATARYVVQPVIEQAGANIAKPIVDSTIDGLRSTFQTPMIWNVLFIAAFIFATSRYFASRRI